MTKGDLVVNKKIPQHVVYAKMEIVPPPQTGGRSESKSGVSGAKPLKKVFRKNGARRIQKIYYEKRSGSQWMDMLESSLKWARLALLTALTAYGDAVTR